MQMEEIVRELPKALINWYPFEKETKALFISGGMPECEVLYDVLTGLVVQTQKCKKEEISALSEKYDYIFLAGVIEKNNEPITFMKQLKALLHDTGKLLIAADNRFAIRYFCGDKDAYTGHVLDGIDNYVKVSARRRGEIKGRAYSKAELKEMLSEAGFVRQKFYSVMPSLTRPQVLISENYIPNEALDIRVFPQYRSPQTVFLEEEKLYDDLLRNGMFHLMANGFLIECSVTGELSDADQITVSGDRRRKDALTTIVKSKKSVVKRPLYQEGRKRLSELLENTQYLRQHNVPIVECRLENDSFVMPYVEGEIATSYFRRILKSDKDKLIEELEAFYEIILHSSDAVPYEKVNWQQFEPGWEKRKADDPGLDKWKNLAFGSKDDQADIGVILKRGYIDLVSLNCFHTENGYLFFDQEFYVENLPANVILIRTIDLIYRDYPELEMALPREETLRHFRLWEHRTVWRKYTALFMEKLRSEKALAEYHKQFRRDMRTVASNRHRMDYTQEEYDRLFTNIFKNTDGRKIYLFGSGKYSEQFIEQFGRYYEIAGIVDNDKNKWGSELSGIQISSPELLKDVQDSFKIFICIKFFDSVLEQLKNMGIKELSVYDPRLDYERPLKQTIASVDAKPKKYHVGYIAGVFDLFHIGHLNLLKRAKEQCDYLIVGVVSDEQVIKDKKTSPYIPFEERIEIVRSCKYTDEAVEIPAEKPGTEEAYRLYHFDVQFSGSDYANDPDWLAKRAYLRQHGSDLVFFPYTQSTSSTKLKEKIGGNK